MSIKLINFALRYVFQFVIKEPRVSLKEPSSDLTFDLLGLGGCWPSHRNALIKVDALAARFKLEARYFHIGVPTSQLRAERLSRRREDKSRVEQK